MECHEADERRQLRRCKASRETRPIMHRAGPVKRRVWRASSNEHGLDLLKPFTSTIMYGVGRSVEREDVHLPVSAMMLLDDDLGSASTHQYECQYAQNGATARKNVSGISEVSADISGTLMCCMSVY